MTADETPAEAALDIRITGGNATPEEVAAVTAVLSAALEELAGEHRRSADSRPSAWHASQRALRKPLPFGAWRNVQL